MGTAVFASAVLNDPVTAVTEERESDKGDDDLASVDVRGR